MLSHGYRGSQISSMFKMANMRAISRNYVRMKFLISSQL